MIRYERGDLLQSQTVSLVNVVNCHGVMGKSIAYPFKEAFPENDKIYREACKSSAFKNGPILTVEENNKPIINFPTKDHWRQKSQYDCVEDTFNVLA